MAKKKDIFFGDIKPKKMMKLAGSMVGVALGAAAIGAAANFLKGK